MSTCSPNARHRNVSMYVWVNSREGTQGWNKVAVIFIRSTLEVLHVLPFCLTPPYWFSLCSCVCLCVSPEHFFHKCGQASGAAVLRKDTNLMWQDSQLCAAQRGPALWRRPKSLSRCGQQWKKRSQRGEACFSLRASRPVTSGSHSLFLFHNISPFPHLFCLQYERMLCHPRE